MNLANHIELQTFHRGSKPAFHYNQKTITYEETNNMINQVANTLSKLGIKKGDRVAIWLPNSIEFVTSFYGILKTGAIVVPINILFKEKEVTHILNDSKATVIITDIEKEAVVRKIFDNLPSLKFVIYSTMNFEPEKQHNFYSWNLVSSQSSRYIASDLSPDSVAAILYTSGTTGNPKGVMLTHYSLYSNAIYYADNIKLSDKHIGCIVTPMSHLLVLMAGVILIPLKGGQSYIFDRFEAAKIARKIVKHKINYFIGVPTMFYMFLELPEKPDFDLSCLDICITSGAQMPLEVRKKFEERFNTITIQAYGQTETSPCISTDSLHRERRFASVGHPLPGLKVRIVDDNGNDVPVNEPGEIIVTGHCLMKGYWNNEEATRKAIRDNWLYTGDIGKVDKDGYLYFLDRKKDVIICGGFNIYPVEVENVIYQHPSVLEAAVVKHPDKRLGEIPVAYVVKKPNHTLTKEELIQHCRDNLSVYKCPRLVNFLSELPKGPTGKILRRKLEKKREVDFL